MRVFIYLVISSLSACVGTNDIDPANAIMVSNSVKVERDDFMDVVTLRGPVISNRATNNSDSPEVEEVALHSVMVKDRPARYFLDVFDYYDGGWRGFDQAFDVSGNKFHALMSRHHVQCKLFCGYDEQLEIELSRKYLEAHASDGLLMRLYGPGSVASAPFLVPAGYIRGFLRACADHGLLASSTSEP